MYGRGKLNDLTIEDYLKLLEEGEEKYEYHDGAVYAMVGGSINHSIIKASILRQIGNQVEEYKPGCFVLSSDAKLHILAQNIITLPDGMVICGPIERSPRDKEAVTNPSIIIEVLSKSTESYD